MAIELIQVASDLQLEIVPVWFRAMIAICLPQITRSPVRLQGRVVRALGRCKSKGHTRAKVLGEEAGTGQVLTQLLGVVRKGLRGL